MTTAHDTFTAGPTTFGDAVTASLPAAGRGVPVAAEAARLRQDLEVAASTVSGRAAHVLEGLRGSPNPSTIKKAQLVREWGLVVRNGKWEAPNQWDRARTGVEHLEWAVDNRVYSVAELHKHSGLHPVAFAAVMATMEVLDLIRIDRHAGGFSSATFSLTTAGCALVMDAVVRQNGLVPRSTAPRQGTMPPNGEYLVTSGQLTLDQAADELGLVDGRLRYPLPQIHDRDPSTQPGTTRTQGAQPLPAPLMNYLVQLTTGHSAYQEKLDPVERKLHEKRIDIGKEAYLGSLSSSERQSLEAFREALTLRELGLFDSLPVLLQERFRSAVENERVATLSGIARHGVTPTDPPANDPRKDSPVQESAAQVSGEGIRLRVAASAGSQPRGYRQFRSPGLFGD